MIKMETGTQCGNQMEFKPKELLKQTLESILLETLKTNFIIKPLKDVERNNQYVLYYNLYDDLLLTNNQNIKLNVTGFSSNHLGEESRFTFLPNIHFSDTNKSWHGLKKFDLMFDATTPRAFKKENLEKQKEDVIEYSKDLIYKNYFFFEKEEIETPHYIKDEIGEKIKLSTENFFIYEIRTFKIDYEAEKSFHVIYCYNFEKNLKTGVVLVNTGEEKTKNKFDEFKKC